VNERFGPRDGDGRLPVALLTGFLGSGKTTLLNRLLRHPAMAKTAVVINEFGEIPLDQHFVEKSEGEVVVLANGCLCCSVPSIRFNLRDLGRIVTTERCDCGSSFRRMDHFLGRSDNMVRMRGVNVHPMACLPAVRSDPRTTGEWVCEAYETVVEGRPREELTVHVEVRRDAGSWSGLKEHLQARLKNDLGLSVNVALAEEGKLSPWRTSAKARRNGCSSAVRRTSGRTRTTGW